MKIELKEITVRELTEGYKDNAEEGIVQSVQSIKVSEIRLDKQHNNNNK